MTQRPFIPACRAAGRTVLLATLLAGPAFAQQAGHGHGHDHAPRHGGVVFEGKEADYELVAQPQRLQLYVSDHGKPVDLARASARLTLLSGADRQDVQLQPADGRLEALGQFRTVPGTKAVAVVTQDGKTLGTARFTLK